MIMDKNLTFLKDTAVNAAAGTANAGDVIDLDAAGVRLHSTPGLSLSLTVSAAFTSGGSATVQFLLVTDSSGTIATDGSATTLVATAAIPYASLTAGAKITIPLPASLPSNERYLALQVVTATATTTAGSISAGLVLDAQDWEAQPDAVN